MILHGMIPRCGPVLTRRAQRRFMQSAALPPQQGGGGAGGWWQQAQAGYAKVTSYGITPRRVLLAAAFSYFLLEQYKAKKKEVAAYRIQNDTCITWKLASTVITERQSGDEFEELIDPSYFNREKTRITFLDLLKALELARMDSRITSMVLDLSTSGGESSSLGLAQIQELRNALKKFSETKRKMSKTPNAPVIVAITDTFESQILYYLATACDEIRMELGTLPLTGLHTVQFFFRSLLDAVGIKVSAYSVGEYKSVMSNITEEGGWPQPQKDNLTNLFRSLNDQIMNGIATARSSVMASKSKDSGSVATMQQIFGNTSGEESPQEQDKDPSAERLMNSEDSLKSDDEEKKEEVSSAQPDPAKANHKDEEAASPSKATEVKKIINFFELSDEEKLRALMDLAPLSSMECLASGLIDRAGYKVLTFREDNLSLHLSSKFRISLTRYIANRNYEHRQRAITNLSMKDYIKSFYDPRAVENGVQSAPIGVAIVYLTGTIERGDRFFNSNRIAKALIDAARDDSVSAIVLRIDSGGGDVVATETIWSAVRVAQKEFKKPVVASLSNAAASGGYYVAASADKIVALPGTITGSIGVAAARPTITKQLTDRLMTSFDEIIFSEGARNNSIMHEPSPAALARFRHHINELYDTFRYRVSEGRKMRPEDVDAVALGRVWTGADAKERGLVDELAGLVESIRIAAKLGCQKRGEKFTKRVEREMGHKIDDVESFSIIDDVATMVYPRPMNWLEKIITGRKGVDEVFADVGLGLRNATVAFVRGVVREAVGKEVAAAAAKLGVKNLSDGAGGSASINRLEMASELSNISTRL